MPFAGAVKHYLTRFAVERYCPKQHDSPPPALPLAGCHLQKHPKRMKQGGHVLTATPPSLLLVDSLLLSLHLAGGS